MRIKIISKILSLLEYLFYSPKLKQIYKNIYNLENRDFICFDVGAHKGESIKIMSKFFPGTRIYAFEPNPNCYREIQKLANRVVKVFNLALGANIGTSSFYLSKHSESSSIIIPKIDSRRHQMKSKVLGIKPTEMYSETTVDIDTIDNFVTKNDIPYITLLKVDCEGSEFDVLNGARNTLTNGVVKYIQFEQHFNDMRTDYSESIFELLVSLKYREIARIKHSFGNVYDIFFLKDW